MRESEEVQTSEIGTDRAHTSEFGMKQAKKVFINTAREIGLWFTTKQNKVEPKSRVTAALRDLGQC